MNKESIEQNWDLQDVIMGEVLQNTDGRTTQKFSSEGRDYIYKIASAHKTPVLLERELKVFDILNERNYAHISKLIKTNTGNLFTSINNQNVFILDYIEGSKPEANPKNWARLGELTAQLHEISDYPFETDFDPNRIITEHFPNIAGELPFADDYLSLAKSLPDFSVLSKSLIHTDIGCHNAIETKDGNLVLIDWDDTGVGISILDIGFPLIVQFYNEDGEFAEENAKAFYQSYFKNRKVSDYEKGYIFDAGLFIAMHYLPYGNVAKRWQVVQKVFADKEKIVHWIKNI